MSKNYAAGVMSKYAVPVVYSLLSAIVIAYTPYQVYRVAKLIHYFDAIDFAVYTFAFTLLVFFDAFLICYIVRMWRELIHVDK